MARKTRKPKHPDRPGRFIAGYGDDETCNERVDIVIDDAQLRKIADELKVLGAKAEEHRETIATAKEELRPVVSRQRLLTDALAKGALSERRLVFKFADDEKDTVALYDAEAPHELLQTREIEDWERQEEMDFEDEDSAEEAEA
jgi:hypothetical protein